MKKFLICEDDADMQELLTMYLKSKNHDFDMVGLGKEVIPTTRVNDYCFLLLDLNLPDIDGREVIKQVRGQDTTKNLPIFIFSASTKAKQIANEFNIDGILEKPFNIKELDQLIAHYTNGK